MNRFAWLVLLFVLPIAPTVLRADDAFFLRGEETVVFFGDSITQNGQYINYVEAYLLTRFPDRSFRLLNHGISSETISGTSESDHQPRRPWAHQRFTRDVAAWNPDVVVACFGMNDGNYHPFESVRFAKYQQGIRRLIRRTQEEAQARLVLMTPPPFDPYRRKASDPDAVTFGYKYPAIDYDDTLAHYSQWLITLRDQGQTVVDLHAPMNEHLRRRRQKTVSFYLAGDAVHPNATGHWLMAQHLLQEWKAPALVAEAHIDAEKRTAIAGDIRELRRDGQALTFLWKSPLPMPMDPNWDAQSIALERVRERLNRYRLTVTNLPAGRYRLSAGGQMVAEVDEDDLQNGIDLLDYPKFPTIQSSRQLLQLVQERRKLAYQGWREQIDHPLGKRRPASQRMADENRIQEIGDELEELRQPRTLRIRLEPVERSDAS